MDKIINKKTSKTVNHKDNIEEPVVITEQTFLDLCMWLSEHITPTNAQIKRLKLEQNYLALIQLANSYWLIGPLTHQLKVKAVFNSLPSQLQRYLTEVESFCLQRSTMIKTEVLFACNLLQQHKIEHVILKGAASLFNGVAKPISIRFMTDIDILIPEEKQVEAIAIFKTAGFKVKEDEFSLHGINHHHAPALARDGVACSVELHRWALTKTAGEVLSTPQIWREAIELPLIAPALIESKSSAPVLIEQPVLESSLHDLENEQAFITKQLSPTHQVILSIAHCEISHKAFEDNQLDLHQLHNLYLLCKFYDTAINWSQVKQHFVAAKQQLALNASLYSCVRLFKMSTPLLKALSQQEKIQAQRHFERCLNLYCASQGKRSAFKYLSLVFSGYSRDSIIITYGTAGMFPVLKGRIKHLSRHLKMVFTPKVFKRFLDKTFG